MRLLRWINVLIGLVCKDCEILEGRGKLEIIIYVSSGIWTSNLPHCSKANPASYNQANCDVELRLKTLMDSCHIDKINMIIILMCIMFEFDKK